MIILKNSIFNIGFPRLLSIKIIVINNINLFNSKAKCLCLRRMRALKNKSITGTVIPDELHPLITIVNGNLNVFKLCSCVSRNKLSM